MRYFKIVLACFGFIFAVVGITVGVLFLTGKFDKEVVQPADIAFEITEKLTEDDFEVKVVTTTENVTEKDVTLSLTNQTETDGMISDGVITIPKVVKLGQPFVVKVNKTHYAGMTQEWNVGGTSVIRAKSTNPLIQEAKPLTVEVDVPVYSIGVELVTTSGTKIGTVAARDMKNYMKTLAEGDEDKNVVELAVGSVVRLKPVFTPEKSAYTTKGEERKVLFEIPTAWKGIHIDFVDGENDLIEVLRQTTVEDIKINAYCFRTSADEYAVQDKGYTNDELITMMNSTGISGESAQIFGTNQKITSFTSTTKDEYLQLAINTPKTLIANGTSGDNAFDLGLNIASDAGVARLEDKIAVIKLFAYWQNDLGEWEDAGDKLIVVGQSSSNKANGVRAKINKNDANLSSWKAIAGETGKYKLVVNLSYEYYSSSSSVPTIINFDIEYNNIMVSDPISSDVSWKSTLPAIKTLVVLDGETQAEKYYPTLNLSDYVDIKNPNATYKVVRYFAYSTEGANLKNILDCSLYDGNFEVPDSSYQYEVFEIPNGILTVKDVGSFRIFFATVVSDYLGNPKMQFGQYLFESFSNTNTINVVKSLKNLDASMAVNVGEDGKDYNKNTDENTNGYIFHVRQQDEKVFTLSLYVSDIEIFERDYADGKISIDFLLGGEKSDILAISGEYQVDEIEKRIDFQVSVNALPDNNQPTLECKITYELDHRLDKFVSNNGNKVQIKVLNGFAQQISFDAVKDANPKNSAENPIRVEINFNAGSDNIATNVEYSITLNGQNLILEDLSKVTINEDALNKTYTMSSSKPAVIAVEDAAEGAKLSILGSTQDEDVVITATAADGSGLSTSIYFKVLASLQITMTPNESEITIDGYQGNQINFRSYFDAKAGDIDLNNLIHYNVPIENTSKFAFADDTLKVVSTLGRDASLQLYVTSDFGFTKIIPIRIVSNITATSTYALNDQGLDDADFVERGETPPAERGTRVYAENSREISFVITQEKPTSTNISISVDDFELPKNGGIQSITYGAGVLTICFDAVSQMTEKTIIFKKNFSENDEYAFVYTMKFLVFPNIRASFVSSQGTEQNPASYVSGETVIYDAKNNSNGLIKLERILGSNIISEHAVLQAKINGEWVALSSNSGVFVLPSTYRATEGGFVEIKIIYDGYAIAPIQIFLTPFFEDSILLDAKVLYGGKLYVPFIAGGDNPIALSDADGVVYSIVNATSEQYLRIRGKQIEKLDRLYTKIISSEKLRIENKNGATELPILILPVKYPFVLYSMIAGADQEETYRTVDLKQVIESETIYDSLEAGGEEVIDLKSKLLVDGLNDGGAIVTVVNADGSTNKYVNFDQQNLTLSANPVGKDQMIYVNVKCGAEFEEAFAFIYRVKITANQQIKVFYPYIEYTEDYNVDNAYEYLYFGSKNQVSVDLLEEFDANKTPNRALLEQLFETTNGNVYARRFVVVRDKDGKLIPLDYKDLHFEIASVGIGKTVIPVEQISNYATINEKTTTSGELESANLFINRGQATETIYVTIRAYTSSGAEAYYRFRVGENPVAYKVYYKNQRVTSDDFSVASNGQSDINLNESVLVKIDENPEQVVSSNAYKFYLIIHEKLGTDYSQFIKLDAGHIQISTLVNDVETTIVIYNAAGEIARFNLILKCTIDHEIKSTTIGVGGGYDIGSSIDFFNTTQSTSNYSMQEISTRLYVKDYLNGSDIGTTLPNNLFINIGGYSIKDISKDYNQYVLLDNIKVYAENLFDTWGGKFYVGDEAKYDILSDYDGKYIRYNGSVIRIREEREEQYFDIPLQSTTDTQTVSYQISEDGTYVIIPHLQFSSGNDTRDYVLFDLVFHPEETKEDKQYQIEPYGVEHGEYSFTTYVYAYVNGYIRYKVETETELKVSILRVSHNNVQYIASVDSEHNDDEYIVVDDQKHYFTRFYRIDYDGLAENKQGETENVPKIRYMLKNDETTIDLSKIIFFTQEGYSDNVLKLDGNEYKDGLFSFFVDDGSGNLQSVDFVETQGENSSKTWEISIAENRFQPINIVIQDTTAKFVVGRVTIVPTVETSTNSAENNKTLFVEAGSSDIDYKLNSGTIELEKYKGAMSSGFSGVIDTDHAGWKNYVYSVNSEYGLSIDSNGEISGLGGKAPWGSITVDAQLRYNVTDKELTTTIDYAAWKTKFFGDNFASYSDLKAQLIEQKIDIKLSETVSDGESVEFDADGNIINVAYGSKITISFVQKCEECHAEVALNQPHECWYVDQTATITELREFSDDKLSTLAGGDSVEIVDESGLTKYVYVLTMGSTLTKDDETGVWTLSDSITKTTLNKHTFTAKFEYQEEKSGELPLTLVEEPKESEEDPTTYGLAVSADDLQAVWSGLGFASFVDFKNSITSISSSAGAVVVEDTGITISGSSQQNITLSYVVIVPKTLETNSSTCDVGVLDLNDASGYSTLAKALFGAGAENILGYASWNDVLADCNISFDGGYNSNDMTFGGGKIITLTLITNDPKHTGTFYLVNQEHENKTLHETGNLDKLGLSGDYVSENEIASVVKIGDKWVLPMTTTKYLIGGTGNEKLQEIIANYTSGLTDYYVVWKDKALDNESGYALEMFVFGENTELKTAAELTGDPFNTLTIYQNNYAIANIHIYLEDYAGDNSYNNYKIYSSAPSETSLKIEKKNEESEVVSSVEFVVKNNLLTTILTKDAADKEKVTYLTQNAVMNDNQYLFSNGLLVEYDGTNIKLKMIAKSAPLSFEFEGVDFNYVIDSTSDVTEQNYFEGLVDLMEQSTCDNFSKGNKTYKAEKTGNAQDDSDVVYKDKIEGSDFNFDNWEFATSYENENGATMEASGKEITIVNLGDNKQIKIVITKIKDAEGNLIEGGYTFVVDLVEKSAVTIIGGGENGATSPSSPLDGGTIASSQTKTINLKGDVFDVDQTSAEIKVDYYGEKGKDAEADTEEMINALFDRNSLSYLKGVLNDEGYTYSSNVFRFKKDGDVITISIIFTSEAEEREYIIVCDDVTDEETGKTTRKFALVDSDGTLSEGYTFEIQLNTDLYDFVGKIQQLDESGALPGEGLSEGGETPGSEEENGSESEGGTEEPLPPAEPSKQLVITITPVFTYNYKIESNGSAVKVESFDKETGALTLTGNHTSVDTVVKFRFSVLRGRGESAKEVAFAYCSLAVKPSVGVVVTYPTIWTKDGKVAQATEYFYAGAGEFDINAKSNLSVGDEVARMAITRYAYGTDNNKTATYEVNGENVTISVDGNDYSTFEKIENNVYTISDVGSFYIPTLEVSYTASSSQNIIKGQDGGKFTFDFSDVSVSEANVVISVQATVGGNKYTFGQYSLTVCKNPVISTLITTEDGHLDENGAEILPIDGGTALEPFNETINGTPRLQFVYNNLILSSDYNSLFKANDGEISGFTIPQNAIDADAQSVAFTFNGQKVSGEYKYKRVWDFKMNPTLDSHTIEGIYDPNNPSELLNYYYLDAGKIYNIVETFGITRYFGQKFDKEIFGLKHDVADNKCVELVSGGQGINIKGAPNGGMNVKLTFKPYEISNEIVVGITILPSLQININYQTETIYGDDPYVYGLISNSQSEYNLVVNSVGQDFSITRDGTTAQINESDFHFVVVSDDGVGAVIEQTTTAATLKISTPPTLNAKRVVIKISDNYGYVEYLRYVVAAKTQVEISTSDITFTTGGKIDWNDNTFPIQFKKENEETTQLASFYIATISGATETNVRDSYGDVTSLKAKDGTLYGVQLGALITLTNGEDESYYVPFVAENNVSYDVYKLAAKDSDGNDVVLKSFDKYEKIQVEYNGHTWIKNKDVFSLDGATTDVNLFGADGNLIPQKDGDNYITNYIIKFFSSSTSENPVAIMTFDLLQVQSTDNLYYASRDKADDCYTFEYSILIDGKNIVTDKTINNIGNAQYGAAQSLNTTLEIAVYDGEKTEGEKPVDTIYVPILLKFGIYPEIKQQISGLTSFDYVGLGDNINYVLTNKKENIKLVADSSVEGFVEPTPKYSKVLGEISSIDDTFTKMGNGTLGENYSYDQTTRVLSLTATLSSGTATINNIQYTYDSTQKTLTIGYRVVSLADGEFVDDVTGITYKVDGTTLSVSKAVDNANTVTINNKKYSISNNGTTIDYETLYESIFVVWEYNGNTYWAQWNYKVVDKFNQVKTDDPLEAQDGVVKVKLDWVSGDYRFNPNTLEFTDGTNTYKVVRRSTVSDSGYFVTIGETEYKIVIIDGVMKFNVSGTETYYKVGDSELALTEEKGSNTSWADKIKLTGLDQNVTSLKGAQNIRVYVNGGEIADYVISASDLSGTTWSVEIKYTGIDDENALKLNGNDVKVTFEHFSATA